MKNLFKKILALIVTSFCFIMVASVNYSVVNAMQSGGYLGEKLTNYGQIYAIAIAFRQIDRNKINLTYDERWNLNAIIHSNERTLHGGRQNPYFGPGDRTELAESFLGALLTKYMKCRGIAALSKLEKLRNSVQGLSLN